MSCRDAQGVLSCLVLGLLLAGCAKRPVAVERIAVPPFENQTADPDLDWMSRGFAEALTLHLAGSAGAHVFRLGSLRDAAGARATHVVHGYFTRAGARLRVETVLEDAGRVRMVKRVSAAGEGVLPAAQAIAAGLKARARPFGASREAALRAYVEGLTAGDAGAAAEAFQRAVTEEADFGAAYLAWAQRLAASGDAGGAREVMARAGRRGKRIAEIERARLAVLAAALEGDRAAERRALLALAQAVPADSDVFRRLGDLAVSARRQADAASFLQQASARDPDHPLLLNQLGYAQSHAGDLNGAVRSLRRYQKLRPEEANPLDSLGDVHYHWGRFAEAERYYLEAWRKDPLFLGGGEPYKAAWARLMRGDRKGADDLLGKYVATRKASGDPLAEFRRAEWEYVTGRRREAAARVEGLTKGAAAVPAWVQLGMWSLDAGQRESARQYAARAAAAARDPAAGLMARVCQFLAGPEAGAAEWTLRAERAFPEAAHQAVRRSALMYALLFSRQFGAALPLLRELYEQTPATSSEPVNVLLAWALIETNRAGEAAELLKTYPLPYPGAEQPFHCLSFPRFFRLRGMVLEKEGRHAEAQAAYRLFEMLGGAAQS